MWTKATDNNVWKPIVVVGFLIAVVVLSLVSVRNVFAIDEVVPDVAQETISQVTDLTDNLLVDLYQEVSPSVVAISVQGLLGGGSGSGFVIDQEGHIVTNNHVVEGADEIIVSFFDGTLARADVVGLDPNSDVAVIQVDLPAEKLHPVPLGDSDGLQVGETVIAIGSPFGQRWTLTSGIISATERSMQGPANFSIGGVIQTDAAINPGNSGGPLLNLNGEVIGVNTQILSSSLTNSGVGFSVPSNLTKRVAEALIREGDIEYSFIGISGSDVTINVMEELGLPNDFRGVVVSNVVEGGPADRAGLNGASVTRDGDFDLSTVDIITAIDGKSVRSMEDLISHLASNTTPGDTVMVTLLRSGAQSVDVPVLLSPRS